MSTLIAPMADRPGRDRALASVSAARFATTRGRWFVKSGGVAEVSLGIGSLRRLVVWRREPIWRFPVMTGALTLADPVNLTMGEISAAIDKTAAVRLTLADVLPLGNDQYEVDVIVSQLGDDAGPDETTRLAGYVSRQRDGSLRLVLSGPAPRALDPTASVAATRRRRPKPKLKLTAEFER